MNLTQTLPYDDGHLSKGVIHASNESRFQSANYSEPLTAFTVGWQDPSDLLSTLNFIAPNVHTSRRFEFKKANNAEAFYTETDDVRAIGSAFKRVEYTGESVYEKTFNKGLTIRIDHDDIIGSDWQERHVQLLLQRLCRNELCRALEMLRQAATNQDVTWQDNGQACNPDAQMRKMLISAADASGIRPNRIIMGEQAWDMRVNAYDSQNNAGAFRSAALTPKELSRKLLLKDVQVVDARYQSSPTEKTHMAGKEVFAFYAQNGITKDEPSNLKRFVTPTENGSDFRVYIEDHAKFTDITVEHYSSIVITSDLGLRKLTVQG